ncbi:MAG TPA: cupin domain-containing protein, partial [Opitutus sp.]|nr:cupin domain-containing protein [Opitutus sp.]
MAQAPSPETSAKLGSAVFAWDEMVAKPTGVGVRRDINDGPTATMNRFECHISTLKAGLPSHPPHQHAQEELIIIKEGTLDVHINGEEHRIGPGSLFFFASNDWHAVRNVGDTDATYLVFNFATDATRTAPKEPAAKSASPDKLPSG